jgi:hypothetical protein
MLINVGTITAFLGARRRCCTKFDEILHLNLGARLAMHNGICTMYSQHSRLAQLFGDDSDGFRSGLDDDGSDMEICGVRGSFLGGSQVGRG